MYPWWRVAVLTIFILLLSAAALAGGEETISLAMTGSLYALSPVEVPQGGVVNSSEFYVVVFNHGRAPVNVSLEYEAPRGIVLEFSPSAARRGIMIPPGGYVKVLVAIRVLPDTLPGTYTVYVKAVPHVERREGLVVIGAGLAQRFEVRVTGEAASLTVVALDPGGRVARNALIRLYREHGGRMVSIVDSYGMLVARVVPGSYVVKAYLAGEEAASAAVSLGPGESRRINLTLRIAYFELFHVSPLTRDGEIIGLRVQAILKNLYRPLADANVVLVIERDGTVFDEYYVMRSSTLPEGRNEFRLDYVPATPFTPGNYTVYMAVYAFNGRLIAVSEKHSFTIHGGSCIPYCLAAALAAAAAEAARRKLRRRSG